MARKQATARGWNPRAVLTLQLPANRKYIMHKFSIKSLSAVAVSAVSIIMLSACMSLPQSGVEAGDGPAAAQPSQSIMPSPSDAPMDTPPSEQYPEDEPAADGAGTGEELTAEFGQKITYVDGIELEVTKITIKETTEDDYYDVPTGTKYQQVKIRIKNGSDAILSTLSTVTLMYGMDGEEADQDYADDLDGKVLPGRAITGTYNFFVPEEHAKEDVVLMIGIDFDHESAFFVGKMTEF